MDFDNLSDVGKEIDTFFLNESNVSKLIEYLSLEENKGEPLRCHHIYLFKVRLPWTVSTEARAGTARTAFAFLPDFLSLFAVPVQNSLRSLF